LVCVDFDGLACWYRYRKAHVNPFDLTKVWPHSDELEQAAFAPPTVSRASAFRPKDAPDVSAVCQDHVLSQQDLYGGGVFEEETDG